MSQQNPRVGVVGSRAIVFTNVFPITAIPNKEYYHYDVIRQHKPDGTSKEIKPSPRAREFIDKLQDSYPAVFNPRALYDGGKNMYSTVAMRQENFDVRMARDPNSTRGIYNVTIKRVATIRPSDVQRLMSPGGTVSSQANTTAVNLLQVIISQAPNMQHHFALHSKSFYVPHEARQLATGGLEAWRGFFQSVRPVLHRIVINVDTTTAAVYKPIRLLDSAMEYFRTRDIRDFVGLCNRDDRLALRKLRTFYKGVVVTVPGGRKGKIDDIVLNAGSYEFPKGGGMSTVREHFLEHHQRILRFPEVFGVRLGKTAVYPAEVCDIFPGQVYKKKLDGRDTTEFLKLSTSKPKVRLSDIRKAVSGQFLGYANSPYMQQAGMTVSDQPMQVNGRLLPPPRVVYNAMSEEVRDGKWNVVGKRFHIPARGQAWAVVQFDSGRDALQKAEQFARNLYDSMSALGIAIRVPKPYIAIGNQMDPIGSLTNAALASVAQIPEKPKPMFVLVILPHDAPELRKAVKQWGDMMQGIPTQCVRAGKYEGGNNQYCNNVALKVNAKAGGVNSTVSPHLPPDYIMVGCDVAHPSPGVKSRPSIASLVASVDEFATRYYTEVRVQAPRQETVDNVGGMIQNALVQYQKMMKRFPSVMMFYRDGVSEGEYAQVEEIEISAIQAMLDDLEKHTGHKVRLVFIVVGKRHHIRFFPTHPSQEDKTGNLSAGLVVDQDIVHSRYMDFYLQSQAGLKGTSRPGHYVVLKNDAGLSPDTLQQYSFALCHVYAAATRSVSIPAPVYYADRLCTRAEYQFKDISYDDENSTHTSECDLEKWKGALGQSKLNQQMYFI